MLKPSLWITARVRVSIVVCLVDLFANFINHDTFHSIDNNEQHEFTISGMDDEIRENYKISHPIGTIISYEHSGLTDSGKPRFARYIRKRDDVTIKDMPVEKEASVEKRNNIITVFGKLYQYDKGSFGSVLMVMLLIH